MSEAIGDVAQLVEHMVCNHGVAGSNPVVSTSWSGRSRGIGVDPGERHADEITKLFDKLGVKKDRRGFSSENPVKLHKVHVRMPWYQEPTKDVA